MVASLRRISVSLSSRPWLYWISVTLVAVVVGGAVQRATRPVVAAPCPGATTPSSDRGLAVPLGEPALPVHVGDHVDIVGVAQNLMVLQVTDTAAVVAVQPDDIDAVVASVKNRATTLALVQRAP